MMFQVDLRSFETPAVQCLACPFSELRPDISRRGSRRWFANRWAFAGFSLHTTNFRFPKSTWWTSCACFALWPSESLPQKLKSPLQRILIVNQVVLPTPVCGWYHVHRFHKLRTRRCRLSAKSSTRRALADDFSSTLWDGLGFGLQSLRKPLVLTVVWVMIKFKLAHWERLSCWWAISSSKKSKKRISKDLQAQPLTVFNFSKPVYK